MTKDRIIQNTAPLLPIETLRFIHGLVWDAGGFDGHLSSTALVDLAMRAAVLGDMNLALAFLDVKGENLSSNDRSIEEIYRLAPASFFAVLRERCRKAFPSDRASLLAALVGSVPDADRPSLIPEIVENRSCRNCPGLQTTSLSACGREPSVAARRRSARTC